MKKIFIFHEIFKFFNGFGGFGIVKKWGFNYGKVILINGRRAFMKTREFLWRKRGENEGLRRGKNEGLAAVFHLESAELQNLLGSKYQCRFGQRQKAFKSLQEPTVFCHRKLFLEVSK